MLRNLLTTYPLISLLRRPTTVLREFYALNLYTYDISRVMRKENVGVIHAHFAYPEGLIGLLAKRNTRKPLIVTLHGYDILTDSSIGYGSRLDKRVASIIDRVLNGSDAIVVASKIVFDEVSKIVDDVDKIHVIPQGVDIQKFRPNLDGSDIKRKMGIEGSTVVFALRWHEPKYGLEYLVNAASIVGKKRTNVLFIIGSDGSLRNYHKQLTIRLGIEEKVVFTGEIPNSETPYYYAMSDMVVVPSVQEAFGLVVSEAMACGKPVIGTKVGGIPDQIVEGYNGFLVQPKSASELAERILWLADNPTAAKRMGLNGRKTVEEKFDIDKRVDQMISLYKVLLADHQRAL
jgi:glycosyltransferase involved in cell wall biosynthesis